MIIIISSYVCLYQFYNVTPVSGSQSLYTIFARLLPLQVLDSTASLLFVLPFPTSLRVFLLIIIIIIMKSVAIFLRQFVNKLFTSKGMLQFVCVCTVICRTNLTCTQCILHTLSILQLVSTYHTCHRQGIFVVNTPVVQRTIWKRYDNNYENSLTMAPVLCRNMLQYR